MAFNIWERWPWTSFQNLNLDWLMKAMKNAVTDSEEAVAKAEAVEAEVGTYSQRISDAETDAETARTIAYSVQADVTNAQSDATSAIAIGQAAQSTANAATTTANNAMSIANGAADSAELAVDSATDAARDAAVAVQLANLANDDYINVGITVFPSNPVQATKNADEILAAVTANKKIKFTLDDSRNGDTHTTYDYTIDPVENTSSDIDINVIFDISVSNSLNKYIVVTFHKVVSGGNTTYSITCVDVSFSGGGGGGGYSPYLIPVTMSGGVYSTTATGADVFDNILDCRIISSGLYYYPIGSILSGAYGHAYFACIDPSASGKYDVVIFDVELNGPNNACTVTKYDKDVLLNGAVPYIPISASSSVIPQLQPNTLVEYTGDATNLSITLATPSDNSISNEYHFIFHSGSTPTTLTLPNTVRQPDGFTVEANHVYEVSILNNNMTAQGWLVTP